MSAASAEGAEQTKAPDWDDSYYARFTPAKFRGYRPANRPIDFKNVDHELLSAAIFFETNLRRIKHHKRRLLYSPALRKAAFDHARDMAEKDFVSHVNPDDPRKKTLPLRLALVGVGHCVMLENIAQAPGRPYPILRKKPKSWEFKIDLSNVPPPHTYVTLARQVVDAWMFSPGHRKNVLATDVWYMGAGAYYCRKELLDRLGKVQHADYFKACQVFAARRGPDAGRDPRRRAGANGRR